MKNGGKRPGQISHMIHAVTTSRHNYIFYARLPDIGFLSHACPFFFGHTHIIAMSTIRISHTSTNFVPYASTIHYCSKGASNETEMCPAPTDGENEFRMQDFQDAFRTAGFRGNPEETESLQKLLRKKLGNIPLVKLCHF